MYYRWGPQVRTWHGKTVEAGLQPFADRWFDIKLWRCSPIHVPIPLLEFTWDGHTPLSDLLFSASTWYPCSARLRRLLRLLKVKFEEFPCRLIDTHSGSLVSGDYAVIHLLECHGCMDLDQSVYRAELGDPGTLVLTRVHRIIPTQSCLDAAYPLFRLAEAPQFVLAHEQTRDLFLNEGVTGVDFLPIDNLP